MFRESCHGPSTITRNDDKYVCSSDLPWVFSVFPRSRMTLFRLVGPEDTTGERLGVVPV